MDSTTQTSIRGHTNKEVLLLILGCLNFCFLIQCWGKRNKQDRQDIQGCQGRKLVLSKHLWLTSNSINHFQRVSNHSQINFYLPHNHSSFQVSWPNEFELVIQNHLHLCVRYYSELQLNNDTDCKCSVWEACAVQAFKRRFGSIFKHYYLMPQKLCLMNNRKKQVKIDVAFMFKTTTMQPQEAKEKYPTS